MGKDGRAEIKGLTVATKQALYTQGDYNADPPTSKKPAALLADTINILSNALTGICHKPAFRALARLPQTRR